MIITRCAWCLCCSEISGKSYKNSTAKNKKWRTEKCTWFFFWLVDGGFWLDMWIPQMNNNNSTVYLPVLCNIDQQQYESNNYWIAIYGCLFQRYNVLNDNWASIMLGKIRTGQYCHEQAGGQGKELHEIHMQLSLLLYNPFLEVQIPVVSWSSCW